MQEIFAKKRFKNEVPECDTNPISLDELVRLGYLNSVINAIKPQFAWWSMLSNPSTTATEFASLNQVRFIDTGGVVYTPDFRTEANVWNRMPLDINIRELHVFLVIAPGTGKSYTFTVRDDSVGTAATVTISDLETQKNWAGLVGVDAGSLLALECVPVGTPAATAVSFVTIWEKGG